MFFDHFRLASDDKTSRRKPWGQGVHGLQRQKESCVHAKHYAPGALAHTLFAFSDFCLAEPMLNGFVGFGGHNLDIHPELPAIILNDADVSPVNTTNSSCVVMFCSVNATIPAWRAACANKSRALSCLRHT